ncbi:MAG: hypothetical protein GY803_18515 [Chloroflexi bacterium]|nr:hypothetical protein [Chloroflexota bacterium]
MKRAENVPLTAYTKFSLAALLLFPPLMGLFWGAHFSEEVYVLLRYARSLANGGGLIYDTVVGFAPPPLTNPLFAAMIGAFSKIGLSLDTAALSLSVAGWIVVGIAFILVRWRTKRQMSGATAVFLLSFNPSIIAALGNAHSWSLAAGWMSLAWLTRRRRMPYIISLALFWGMNPHFLAPVLTLLLGVYETGREKRFPVKTAVAATGSILIWIALGQSPRQWLNMPNMLLVQAAFWTLLLFLVSVGAACIKNSNSRYKSEMRFGNWNSRTFALGTAVVVLGLAQGWMLRSACQERPLAQWQLEAEMAAWLHAETPDAAALLASEKVGYLAGRTAVSPAASVETWELQETLQFAPINYLIGSNVIAWQNLAASPWFRLSYTPVKRFENPYAPAASYTVWAFRPPLAGWDERQTLNVQAPDRLDIVGYQFKSRQIQPGENLQLALYLQTPEALVEPPAPFQAVVRLVSPVDGRTLLEWEEKLPSSLEAASWKPSQLIIEQITILVPNQLEIGAYLVNISLRHASSAEFWPLSRDNDINPLDRFALDFVSVPWQGSLEEIQSQTAFIDSQINLLGYTLSEPQAGKALSVALFWQALQTLDENHVVFVHILDSAGRLAANHDAVPMNGRYPTVAWQTNGIIPDEHNILLPANLPAGQYQIKVGLYLPETGERLPATDGNGVPFPDNAILLTQFAVE